MISPLLKTSDKFFWHGYIPFYERHFSCLDPKQIVEFGVFKGNSVRWLLERFPKANIHAVDILDIQPEWPQDPRLTYFQQDQSDETGVARYFENRKFDLIIEDGSHIPAHQAICLKYGFASLNSGGIYVLEDIHTSHLSHPLYISTIPGVDGSRSTSLSVLLAIDHLKRTHQDLVSLENLSILDDGGVLDAGTIEYLFEHIDFIELYRRTHLPDCCHQCGATVFDYHKMECFCGQKIFDDADSMSFIIKKK